MFRQLSGSLWRCAGECVALSGIPLENRGVRVRSELLLLFYLWLLHRGLRGRSARDKSKMKNHGAFLLLLLAFWNKRRYNRMKDDSWGKLISSSGSLAEINPLAECKHIAEGEIHYLAETPVPEPWNSWYFGGMP